MDIRVGDTFRGIGDDGVVRIVRVSLVTDESVCFAKAPEDGGETRMVRTSRAQFEREARAAIDESEELTLP